MKTKALYAFLSLAACIGLILSSAPSLATIKGEMDAGMSLQEAIVKAMDEEKSCPEIMAEALEAVPDILVAVEAAIKAGVDAACVVAQAIKAGGDPWAVADTAMAAGASLGDVQNGLAAGGFPTPEEYAYMPSAPSAPALGLPAVIAGGIGAGGGGGKAASPNMP